MMDLTSLLEALGYSRSQGNWVTPDDPDPRVSSLFREAQRANVLGAYVYHTRRDDKETPPQPAVYVARATDEAEARQIQKQLFCLGNCPFVLIITPNAVRAYTCFRYDADNPESARINPQDADTLLGLTDDLEAFQAEEIDSGHIWERLAKYLSSDKRVDTRLLNNLRQLSVQLQKRFSLPPGVAHALIGKYIYFYYLRDRGILGQDWLQKHQIATEEIFGRDANAVGFQTLADALQTEFNGVIFPLPEGDDGHWRTDGTIPFLARIFAGDEFQESSDAIILQLALDFQVYDFSFIPVELLSSIYEQFLKDEGSSNTVGVVYTPEPLADYVFAEMEAVHPLRWGHRVLDPCCGSGVFLVLAYRRLVELARRERGVLTADQLKQILEDSIFGVERDPEACQITAFSLILTLLSYLESEQLPANGEFQFPTLVGQNIFQADFFDDTCPVFVQGLRFDWIAGNPPWTAAPSKSDTPASLWMNQAIKSGRVVGGRRLDEAFTWRAGELLTEDGCAGLLVMATSLVNPKSSSYRKAFFRTYDVRRITNFSHFLRVMFIGRAEAPAACLIYTKTEPERRRRSILHFGPFVVDQVTTRSGRSRIWSITLYESDIQHIDYQAALEDEPCLWKTALWGTFLDRRTLSRLRYLLPHTMGKVIDEKEWTLASGLTLKAKQSKSTDRFAPSADLRDKNEIDMKALNRINTRFNVPNENLSLIESERQFIRVRGGAKGLNLISAPHLLINATLAVFSSQDFVIPAPQLGIAGSDQDTALLKAVALYLNSSIARYMLFFLSAPWGVTISIISPNELRKLSFPALTEHQIEQLAALYDGFAERERLLLEEHAPRRLPLPDVQDEVDDAVEGVLKISDSVSMVAHEFMGVRYELLKGKKGGPAIEKPNTDQLTAYAEQLRLQVDDFARRHHRVAIHADAEAIIAEVEVTLEAQAVPVSVSEGENGNAHDILRAVREQHSQWAYVQRSVRIFDGPRVHIVKAARLLDWTRTQAIQDAGDLISEALDKTATRHEPVTT